MTAPTAPVCEVKTGDLWITVPLIEARARHGFAPKRCPACHGGVQLTGAYASFQHYKLVHRRRHDGCPLTPKTFSGVASPHPLALS